MSSLPWWFPRWYCIGPSYVTYMYVVLIFVTANAVDWLKAHVCCEMIEGNGDVKPYNSYFYWVWWFLCGIRGGGDWRCVTWYDIAHQKVDLWLWVDAEAQRTAHCCFCCTSLVCPFALARWLDCCSYLRRGCAMRLSSIYLSGDYYSLAE